MSDQVTGMEHAFISLLMGGTISANVLMLLSTMQKNFNALKNKRN
jgi:hypothetical protein